jgi:drug/metabolite transporter (DMT)-like permease
LVLTTYAGSGFDVFFQSWNRALIIVIALFPFLYYKKQIVPIQRVDRKWLFLFLFFTAFTQAPIFYAYTHMDIGSANLFFFVSTLLTMYIVGTLFLKEKMSPVKIISFIVAILGMCFVFSFSLKVFALLAVTMAIVNGIASGGEIAFSKKISGAYSTLYITWLSWVVIVITNLPISLALGETQHLPALSTIWLWHVMYAIASIFGFWAVIEGLKHLEAGVGGLLGLLEIIFSIAFGVLFFSEKVTAPILIGGLLIIFASALPHLVSLKRKI